MTLRSRVIRLAHKKPELRSLLLPLVKRASVSDAEAWGVFARFAKTLSESARNREILALAADWSARTGSKSWSSFQDYANDLHSWEVEMARRMLERMYDSQPPGETIVPSDDFMVDLSRASVLLGPQAYDKLYKDPWGTFPRMGPDFKWVTKGAFPELLVLTRKARLTPLRTFGDAFWAKTPKGWCP